MGAVIHQHNLKQKVTCKTESSCFNFVSVSCFVYFICKKIYYLCYIEVGIGPYHARTMYIYERR